VKPLQDMTIDELEGTKRQLEQQIEALKAYLIDTRYELERRTTPYTIGERVMYYDETATIKEFGKGANGGMWVILTLDSNPDRRQLALTEEIEKIK
jgi:hypothetical protein